MPNKDWWYTRLSAALKALDEGEGFEDAMVRHAEIMRDHLMKMVVLYQPYGHEEWDPDSHYRRPADAKTVSDRIGHTAIEDGWRFAVEPHVGEPGIKLQVKNVSEHILAVVRGAKRHEIPGNPKLHFWWGEPQQWPAPESHGVTGAPMGPGYYTFSWVDHPGQDPNPFMTLAKDAARGDMAETAKAGVGEYLTELMSASGLRRV